MKLKIVRDLNVKNKRVLVGVDYNVPIADGIVGDPLRIEASFETIKYLLQQGCSLVLVSHLGRPKGKVVPEMSLAPVAKKAGEMLGQHITFVPDCVGPQVEAAANDLQPGEIILCENVRFHKEEEANDDAFAAQLAKLGEVFVNDAFANIHRQHASVVGVTKHLPSTAGFLVEKEVRAITGAMEHPAKPLVAIVAGAKVSTKIGVLDNFIKHVDKLVIGGAMANTFLAARGLEVGKSLKEPEFYDEAKRVEKDAAKAGVELLLPEDVIISSSLEHGPGHHAKVDEVGKKDYIVDLGSHTISKILNPLNFHGTVIWNGPLGITEVPAFAHNSRLLADNIIESGAHCIIGGGDTAAFVDEAGLHDQFTWVSTGGGASLELMAGNKLPGIEALER